MRDATEIYLPGRVVPFGMPRPRVHRELALNFVGENTIGVGTVHRRVHLDRRETRVIHRGVDVQVAAALARTSSANSRVENHRVVKP